MNKKIVGIFICTLLILSIIPSQIVKANDYSISLLFPNNKETLIAGKEYNIRWSQSNGGGTGAVEIYYSLDGGENYELLEKLTGFHIGYAWKVPETVADECKIKVIWVSTTVPLLRKIWATDESNDFFRIVHDQIFVVEEGNIKSCFLKNEIESLKWSGSDTFEWQPSASENGAEIAFVRIEKQQSSAIWTLSDWASSEIWCTNSEHNLQYKLTRNNVADIEPAFSPDGKKIVFTRFDPTGQFSNLYLCELTNIYDPNTRTLKNTITQLTFGNYQDRQPCFSPDGSQIAFSSNRANNQKFQIYSLQLSNPQNIVNMLPASPQYMDNNQYSPDWSPNGKWLAFSLSTSEDEGDIYMAEATGPVDLRKVIQLTDTDDRWETHPAWSPDSLQIAYIFAWEVPFSYEYELWTLSLLFHLDETIEVFENNKFKSLGQLKDMPWEMHPNKPCWNALKGIRVADVILEGRVRENFEVFLHAFGGTPPYTWSLYFGALPNQLSLGSIGKIFGIPTEAVRNHAFIVSAVDKKGLQVTRELIISINAETDLEILTPDGFIQPGVAGEPYYSQILVKGGIPPYDVTVESYVIGPTLPQELKIYNHSSADLFVIDLCSTASGLPEGRYFIKVQIKDQFEDIVAGFFDLYIIKMDPWKKYYDDFIIYVYGLPLNQPSQWLQDRLSVSLEARGIEQQINIKEVKFYYQQNLGHFHGLILPYPENFEPWKGVFNSGESTINGSLNLTLVLDQPLLDLGLSTTASQNFSMHRYMFRRDRGFQFENWGSEGVVVDWYDFVDFFWQVRMYFWIILATKTNPI
ncbi:MAG: hypothetical protein ACFFD2_22330 [Promethearchaeota archaeon]